MPRVERLHGVQGYRYQYKGHLQVCQDHQLEETYQWVIDCLSVIVCMCRIFGELWTSYSCTCLCINNIIYPLPYLPAPPPSWVTNTISPNAASNTLSSPAFSQINTKALWKKIFDHYVKSGVAPKYKYSKGSCTKEHYVYQAITRKKKCWKKEYGEFGWRNIVPAVRISWLVLTIQPFVSPCRV